MRVISGGQTGADIAGVEAAKECGLETGGMMPKGYLTQEKYRPEYAQLYGMTEHSSPLYPPRTFDNAKNSDGTIRFAVDFTTAGEVCTLRAIKQYNKVYLNVKISRDDSDIVPKEESINRVVSWIKSNNIETLNIAGNSKKVYPLMHQKVKAFLVEVFKRL